jgi:transposase
VNAAEVVQAFLASGRTAAEVASQYGLDEQTVRDWIREASDEAVQVGPINPERSRNRGLEAAARAEAAEAAARAEAAEALARAEAAEAKAVKAARALAREKKKAADAMARAEAAAATTVARAERLAGEARELAEAEVAARLKAEASAQLQIAAVYAEAVEAMVRAEVSASEAKARAETAARDEIAAVREEAAATSAAAVEAITRAEVLAAERIAEAEAVAARALALAEAASDRFDTASAEAAASNSSRAFRAPSTTNVTAGASDQAETEEEAAARAEIAALLSRLQPAEVWVQMVGRTLAEARRGALEQLGVDESEAEIEVLDQGSRWLPGRVRVRARIRVPQSPREVLVRPV